MKKIKKLSSRSGFFIGFLLILLIVGGLALSWVTEYIWMDSLDYGSVFTTILSIKVMLGVIGFVLFAIITYITLFWIRKAYSSHFAAQQLPPIFRNNKAMN